MKALPLRLVPLGTNGFYPSHGRQTMSFLLLAESRVLLLDAGTGVGRLGEPALRRLLARYTRLDVLLSHFHLDHVIGLSYLPALWPRGRIRILAPTGALGTAEPADAIDRLIAPPLFPFGIDRFPARVELVPLAREVFRLGHFTIRVAPQRHPGGSIGIRIGDLLAYVTDTSTGASVARFAAGVRLLLHELWMSDREGTAAEVAAAGHTRLSELAETVQAAGVGTVMPVHHHPARSNEGVGTLARRLERRCGTRTVVPREGRVYRVG